MLDLLVENFETSFLSTGNGDPEAVTACLEDEAANLMDRRHLETRVIGSPLFEWDFRALDKGFQQLMRPFMEVPSRIPLLYLHVLRDLDRWKPEFLKAAVLLEYGYYACAINDYFNFHRAFTLPAPDPRTCARLSQIKYAGQYLSTYPRYLVIENHFRLDDAANIRLQRWLANIMAAIGISRGVFVKWAWTDFAAVTAPQYYQHAINALCQYFLYPVVLAAVMAGVPENRIGPLKEAFSYLTLFAKLRLERKLLAGGWEPAVNPWYRDAFIMLAFPGLAVVENGLPPEVRRSAGQSPPDIPAMHAAALRALRSGAPAKFFSEAEKMEQRCFERFSETIRRSGLLSATAERLRQSYDL